MNAKIISADGLSQGTRIVLDGGAELQGVARATFTAEVGDVNRIVAEIFSGRIEAQGLLTLMAQHPEEGGMREVVKIEFADGSVWTAR